MQSTRTNNDTLLKSTLFGVWNLITSLNNLDSAVYTIKLVY